MDEDATQARKVLRDCVVRGRKDAGLSQQQLANRAGISIGVVRKIETGVSLEPGFFVVARIVAEISAELAVTSITAKMRFQKQLQRLIFS